MASIQEAIVADLSRAPCCCLLAPYSFRKEQLSRGNGRISKAVTARRRDVTGRTTAIATCCWYSFYIDILLRFRVAVLLSPPFFSHLCCPVVNPATTHASFPPSSFPYNHQLSFVPRPAIYILVSTSNPSAFKQTKWNSQPRDQTAKPAAATTTRPLSTNAWRPTSSPRTRSSSSAWLRSCIRKPLLPTSRSTALTTLSSRRNVSIFRGKLTQILHARQLFPMCFYLFCFLVVVCFCVLSRRACLVKVVWSDL